MKCLNSEPLTIGTIGTLTLTCKRFAQEQSCTGTGAYFQSCLVMFTKWRFTRPQLVSLSGGENIHVKARSGKNETYANKAKRIKLHFQLPSFPFMIVCSWHVYCLSIPFSCVCFFVRACFYHDFYFCAFESAGWDDGSLQMAGISFPELVSKSLMITLMLMSVESI